LGIWLKLQAIGFCAVNFAVYGRFFISAILWQ